MITKFKNRPGRPRNPNRVIMRKTVVQADPAQMEAIEEAGYTHAEAYRIGLKILLSRIKEQDTETNY